MSIALPLDSELSRAIERVAPFSILTGPVKPMLLPLRVTMPLEVLGTVSLPEPVIGPLTFRFAANVVLKSCARRRKSLVPAPIPPEKPPLFPPAALSTAFAPVMVMALGITEFTAANSAPAAMVTEPAAGRPEALTAKMPALTSVFPPYALLIPTTVAPPKLTNSATAAPVVALLSVATLYDPKSWMLTTVVVLAGMPAPVTVEPTTTEPACAFVRVIVRAPKLTDAPPKVRFWFVVAPKLI